MADADSAGALQPGSTFDSGYRIVQPLARGGMGSIYKAIQLDIGRTVAIKVIANKSAPTQKALERFRREAAAVAKFDHPNIVKAYRMAASDAGPYVVMELVEGTTLAAVLADKGKLSFSEFQPLFLQVLDAIEHAHQHGVVHRDLKPENIMLAEGETKVKIVDFGIAALLDRTEQRVTRTGEIIGTAYYMSPEQAAGKLGDERTDIYALGCIMFRCLIGRNPYEAETPVAVLLQHQMGELEFPPGWDPAYRAVIETAMSRDSETRFQTISEFREALKDPSAFSKPAPSAPVRTPRKQEQHKPALKIVAITAVSVLVAAISLAAWNRPPAPIPSSGIPVGEASVTELKEQLYKAGGLVQGDHHGDPNWPQKALAALPDEVVNRFDQHNRGTAHYLRGYALLATKRTREALREFSTAIEDYGPLDRSEEALMALIQRAYAESDYGDPKSAIKDLNTAQEHASRQSWKRCGPLVAKGWGTVSHLLFGKGFRDDAIACAAYSGQCWEQGAQASEVGSSERRNDYKNAAEATDFACLMMEAAGSQNVARRSRQKQIYFATQSGDGRCLAEAIDGYGRSLMNEPKSALPILQKAVAAAQPYPDWSATTCIDLAQVYERLGDAAHSQQYYQAATDPRLFDRQSVDRWRLPVACDAYAHSLMDHGKLAEAETIQRRAVAESEYQLNHKASEYGFAAASMASSRLGLILLEEGKQQEAEQCFDKALSISSVEEPNENHLDLVAYYGKARIAEARGDKHSALQLYQKAMATNNKPGEYAAPAQYNAARSAAERLQANGVH